MQELWLGSELSDADAKLLKKAMESDLGVIGKYSAKRSSFDREGLSVDVAPVALGSLGKGMIVRADSESTCGATGSCAIYLYVREKEGYRKILGGERPREWPPYGWAFAVVNTKSKIPDLVLASKAGGMTIALVLYRYSGDRFVGQACELLSKKGDGDQSWWDASGVNVRPCSEN